MKRMLAAVMMAAVVMGSSTWLRAEAPPEKTTVVIPAPPAGKLALGMKAPEIDATDLKGGAVNLESFAGKPVVLQFGSLTEPVFRMRVADTEKLAAKYAGKVEFVVVYQKESHPADSEKAIGVNMEAGYAITKPVNQKERMKLAQSAVERLAIKKQKVLVDAWSDTSSQRYGGYPNMTFVIDAKGNLQAGFSWMDPNGVKGALEAVLAGKPVPAEYRGRTQSSGPPPVDPAEATKGMGGGGRGPGLALVVDRLKMTEAQRNALYPALGSYLAASKDLREEFGAGGGRRAAPAPKKDGEMMDAEGGGEKAKDAEAFRKAVEDVRAKAQKLKTVIKENFAEKDAKELLEVLAQGPARRMFAD